MRTLQTPGPHGSIGKFCQTSKDEKIPNSVLQTLSEYRRGNTLQLIFQANVNPRIWQIDYKKRPLTCKGICLKTTARGTRGALADSGGSLRQTEASQ